MANSAYGTIQNFSIKANGTVGSTSSTPPTSSPTPSTPVTSSPGTGSPILGSYESGNVNVAIRELKTSTATLTISTHMAISNLTVTLNISAINDGGLVVKLVSPGGQEVILSNQRGGSGRGFSFTTFDDKAGTAIASGAASFSGTFRPDASLSSFNGSDLFGTWKLVVTEVANSAYGTIQNFSIKASGSTLTTAGTTGEQDGAPVLTTATPTTNSPTLVAQSYSPTAEASTPTKDALPPTPGFPLVAWVQNRLDTTAIEPVMAVRAKEVSLPVDEPVNIYPSWAPAVGKLTDKTADATDLNAILDTLFIRI